MTAWNYILGNEKDFEGVPDWARFIIHSAEHDSKYAVTSAEWKTEQQIYNISWEGGPRDEWFDAPRSSLEVHLRCKAKVKIIAQRERVTSVNDDRLVQALIAERGSRYGKFADGAEIMRDLKHVMHEVDGWNNLTPSQKEALDMIQHKIGRILNGDPTYDDNWKDIAGYATLVAEELNGVKK